MNLPLKREWLLLLVAAQALTRLPVQAPYDPDLLRRSARYMPLVGIGIGACAAFVLSGASHGLLAPIPALLALGATIVLTGALHEDGLADCCDGLFGGRTREEALRIMRDSRIGAFGALGLGVVLAVQVACLSGLPHPALALVAAHAASRFWAITPPAFLPYARPHGMAGGMTRPSIPTLAIGAALGLLPLLLLGRQAGPGLLLSAATAGVFCWWTGRRLGGFTGDVLGATQQLTFTAVLLAAAWHAA